jgi:hypothetical protein
MDDTEGFPNQESESKKKNMYMPNWGTNEHGLENQEMEVPSAQRGGDGETRRDRDLGDVDRSA